MRPSLILFLFAEGASLFGNSAISIVLPWLIVVRTADPATAGLVLMVTGMPVIVAALVGGHLIDRIGWRRTAVVADCGSALSVAFLAVVDRFWGLDVAWFVVLGLSGVLFDVPGMTARETLMANVAETSGATLDRIAALRQSVVGLSFLAGPALAGILLSVLDPIRVVWITAGCSALAALATVLMPLRPAAAVDGGAPKDSPLAGLAVVRANPGLVAVLLLSFASALPFAPLLAVILGTAQGLHGGPAGGRGTDFGDLPAPLRGLIRTVRETGQRSVIGGRLVSRARQPFVRGACGTGWPDMPRFATSRGHRVARAFQSHFASGDQVRGGQRDHMVHGN